jgi:DNA-binding NtrC family response regulator
MSVLIQGESGTGKELVARDPALSPGKQAVPPLNCAAIPEPAGIGAVRMRRGLYGRRRQPPGKLEAAEEGTLFLDEVGDMALSLQAKLLRAIEQKEISRVGGSQVIRVDVRILAATNRDLKERVAEKAFREDLFYRLNVFSIVVPPLRDRREDIPRLADHFLQETGRENKAAQKRLSPEALKVLLAYRWPGNVRELRNAMEVAALVATEEEIGPEDLPPEIPGGAIPPSAVGPIPLPAPRTLDEVERDAIRAAVQEPKGTKKEAAKVLGIGIATLHRKVKEYGIP